MRRHFRSLVSAAAAAALVLAAAPRPAHAVGATNHAELALRGGLWFDSPEHPDYATWVGAYRDALRAGAAYPDWGYAFDGFGDLAEDSHWPPYHQVAAEYVREIYPQPWDEDTQRLVVFLLGIRAHWISDLNWHGLGGVQEGIIDAMSAQETGNEGKFSPGWQEAHTNADTGGEFIGAAQLDLDWAKLTAPWYVPTQDLVEIAARLGYPETEARDVNLGMLALRAEQLGMQFFGQRKIGYPSWAPLSPLLVAEYRDYFVGGINDMAVHAMWSWDENIDWLEDGVPAAMRGLGASAADRSRLDAMHRGHAGEAAHGTYTLRELERMGLRIEETARGAYLRVTGLERVERPAARRASGPFGPRSRTLASAAPYGLAGSSLASGDLDGDGADDLAVGLPGYSTVGANQAGRVLVLSGSTPLEGHESGDLESAASQTFDGALEGARFGDALAVCDLDADGHDDLAVASPTTGARDFGYRGRVEVFFGTGAGLSPSPGLTITSGDDYENLGHTLAGGDLDGDGHADLVVATPFARAGGRQRGRVAVFLSSATRGRGGLVEVGTADWTAAGTQSWAWFGDAVAIARAAGGQRLLLVGAPKWKQGEVQAVGKLFAYDGAAIAAGRGVVEPLFTITGTTEFENLGHSFAVGTPGDDGAVLAIASPSRDVGAVDQAGEVLVVAIDGLAGDLTRDGLTALATLGGDQPYARFGHRLAFGDVDGDGDDDLWVAEPWRDAAAPDFLVGAVYGFLGGAGFPAGDVPLARAEADLVFDETDRAAFLGSALAFPDLDDDGVPELAIGARASSSAAPEAGVLRAVGFTPMNAIFAGDFEAGDTAAWSVTFP